jgi:hypothetical protein
MKTMKAKDNDKRKMKGRRRIEDENTEEMREK